MSTYLTASAASERLGVTRATLYAYVSRGLIRSRSSQGRRERHYLAEDVERLLSRASGRRDPKRIASQALGMLGLPVLTSALTLIDEGKLYYRGRDVLALSQSESFEAVAGLLWGGPCEKPSALYLPNAKERTRLARLPFARAAQCYLAEAETADPAAYLTTAEAVRRSGARILAGLTAVATGQAEAPERVAPALAQAWCLRGKQAAALEAVLILCADHELNVSAFTARAIASAAATPYMAVSGALGALTGPRHGGMTAQVAALFDETGDATRVLVERLRRGEPVPGFGHPLYPDGDPRAARLLELCPDHPVRVRALGLARAGLAVLGERPVLDFGLVALARSLALPASAPFILFALGRTAGSIAHCIEQYEAGQLIRPRAEYVGPAPGSAI